MDFASIIDVLTRGLSSKQLVIVAGVFLVLVLISIGYFNLTR